MSFSLCFPNLFRNSNTKNDHDHNHFRSKFRCTRIPNIVVNTNETFELLSGDSDNELVAYEIGSMGEIELFDIALRNFGNNAPVTLVARADPECYQLLETLCIPSCRIDHAIFLKSLLGDELSRQVARSGCKHVSTLALLHSGITAKGAQLLSSGLQLHSTIRVLDLAHNRCGDGGAESLAVLVRSCPALKTLRLRDNRIESRGAKALAAALLPFTPELALCGGGLDNFVLPAPARPRGAMPLTTAHNIASLPPLVTAPAAGECRGGGLEMLDLSINLIGDYGAIELAAALCSNRSLVALDVSRNSVTVVGAERLADALERNRTLRRMLVRAATVGAEEEAALDALRRRVEGRQCAHW